MSALVNMNELKGARRTKHDDTIESALDKLKNDPRPDNDPKAKYAIEIPGERLGSLINRFYKLQKIGKISEKFKITRITDKESKKTKTYIAER